MPRANLPPKNKTTSSDLFVRNDAVPVRVEGADVRPQLVVCQAAVGVTVRRGEKGGGRGLVLLAGGGLRGFASDVHLLVVPEEKRKDY